MTFQEAARDLRTYMERSQQSMATELRLSIAALRNYESGAVTSPDARAAAAYMMAAHLCRRADLTGIFRQTMCEALGIGSVTDLIIFAGALNLPITDADLRAMLPR